MVGQHARGNKLPFGGLLVIACGDFFQLPPVQIQHSTMRTHTACSGSGAGGISSFRDVDRATSVPIPVSQSCSGDRVVSSAALPAILYCFQHPSWKQVFPSKQINTVVLETVFRYVVGVFRSLFCSIFRLFNSVNNCCHVGVLFINIRSVDNGTGSLLTFWSAFGVEIRKIWWP